MTRHPLIFRLLFLALATLLAVPAAGQFEQEPVTWSIDLSQNNGRPGDRLIVAVTASVSPIPDAHGKHWHFYPNAEEHGEEAVEIPTSFTPDFAWDIFHLGDIQWPATKMIVNIAGDLQPVYEGTQRFYIPVIIDRDAEPGILAVNVDVTFMACASMCLSPQTITLTKAFTVLEPGADAPTSWADDDTYAGFDASGFDGMPTTLDEASAARPQVLPESGGTETSGGSVVPSAGDRIQGQLFGFEYDFAGTGPLAIFLAILLALIGGTVLNLMPCVLPIIPIKIMGLTQASGSRSKSTALGSMMLLGVVSFWIALGLAIATLSGFDSVASLFQRPLFGIGVGVFILVMAAGMMGAFAVGLPQWVYRINPKHDSPVGAFGFGVMAAVLSTPCTAPFMGAAVTWATQQANAGVTLAVFGAIGLGMGWPYMVLAAFPKLVSKVPRTGPASELVKQVLGLMLIATGVFFLGSGIVSLVGERPYLGEFLHWWIIVFVLAGLAFWLSYQTFKITPSIGRRVFFTAAGTAIFLVAGSFAWSLTSGARTIHLDRMAAREAAGGEADDTVLSLWADYTPNRFAHARKEGRITVVEFTADT